jgi:hypothetical protein
VERYRELTAAQAEDLHPRYHVVDAMLVEVERLDPDRLPALAVLADALRRAADTAEAPIPLAGKGKRAAVEHERAAFRAAIDRLVSGGTTGDQPPLAYRRVLTATEAAHWRDRFARRWGVDGVAWHPMLSSTVPEDVLVLRAEPLRDDATVSLLRRALRDAGVRRVIELSESGLDRVIDTGGGQAGSGRTRPAKSKILDIVSAALYIRRCQSCFTSGVGVALEEKRAWIMALVTACTYAVYLAIVLSRAGGGPLAEVPYAATLLWTVGTAIVVTIVLSIAAEVVTPKESRKKDQRDREIERFGEYVGQSFTAIGGVAVLVMALAEVAHFWIANVIYLAFALSALVASVAKIFAYRRGFQQW